MSAEVLGRRHRAALAGRSLSSPSGRANPVPGRPRHPSLDAIADVTGPEPRQELGQGLDDSGKGWVGNWVSYQGCGDMQHSAPCRPYPTSLPRKPALPSSPGLGHADGAIFLIQGCATQWGLGPSSRASASPGSTLSRGDPGPVRGPASVLGGGCRAGGALGPWGWLTARITPHKRSCVGSGTPSADRSLCGPGQRTAGSPWKSRNHGRAR